MRKGEIISSDKNSVTMLWPVFNTTSLSEELWPLRIYTPDSINGIPTSGPIIPVR